MTILFKINLNNIGNIKDFYDIHMLSKIKKFADFSVNSNQYFACQGRKERKNWFFKLVSSQQSTLKAFVTQKKKKKIDNTI